MRAPCPHPRRLQAHGTDLTNSLPTPNLGATGGIAAQACNRSAPEALPAREGEINSPQRVDLKVFLENQAKFVPLGACELAGAMEFRLWRRRQAPESFASH